MPMRTITCPLQRANRLLDEDPSLVSLLLEVTEMMPLITNKWYIGQEDRWNGSMKHLRECLSRAAYLKEQADNSRDKLNSVDFANWKAWEEGFVAGFGWNILMIAENFIEAHRNERRLTNDPYSRLRSGNSSEAAYQAEMEADYQAEAAYQAEMRQ